MGQLKKASKYVQQNPDAIPKGWKTARQWAAEEGFSVGYTSQLIRDLLEAGKWEAAKFKVRNKCGVRPTLHYRPKA
jgi:hypothetical protein